MSHITHQHRYASGHGPHHGHHSHHGGHHHHHHHHGHHSGGHRHGYNSAPAPTSLPGSEEARDRARESTPLSDDALQRAAQSPNDFVYYVTNKPGFGQQFGTSAQSNATMAPKMGPMEWRNLLQDPRACQVLTNLKHLFATDALRLSDMPEDTFNDFCYHQYGTRIVQLALQESDRAEQARVAGVIHRRGLHYDPRGATSKKAYFEDANANHVVAAMMQHCHQSTLEPMLEQLWGSKLGQQARHNFACRYLQRALENTSGAMRINTAWAILTDAHPHDGTLLGKPPQEQQGQLSHQIFVLSSDPYGCYVAQSCYANLRSLGSTEDPKDLDCANYLLSAMEYTVYTNFDDFIGQRHCSRVLERVLQMGPCPSREHTHFPLGTGLPSAQHSLLARIFATNDGTGVDTLFCKMLGMQDRSLSLAVMRCLQIMMAQNPQDEHCNAWRHLAKEALAHVRGIVEQKSGAARGGYHRGHY